MKNKKRSVKIVLTMLIMLLVSVLNTVFSYAMENNTKKIEEINMKGMEVASNNNGQVVASSYNMQIASSHNIQVASNNNTQVVADGIYYIKSAINDKYVLDVTAASKGDSINIALYQYNGLTHQQYKFKYLGNGDYQITAVHSGKSVDVHGSEKRNEANVEQYKINSPTTNNQKWKIQKNSDGTYSFISECNGLYLDVYQANAKNGTNVQMYKGHGGVAQKFELEAVGGNKTETQPTVKAGTKTLEDGKYYIKSAINDKFVLNVVNSSKTDSANICLYQYNGQTNQQFTLKYLNDGFYQITVVHSGKSMDVHGSGTANETNVEQYKINSPITKNQKWRIDKNSDGTYSVVSQCNGLYLDVYAANAKNGTNVQMYKGHGKVAQKFKFVKIEQTTTNPNTGNQNQNNQNNQNNQGNQNNQSNATPQGTRTISNGTYSIASAVSDNCVLDVEGGSKDNNANIQIYEKQSAKRQKFKIEYLANGYYKIEVGYSGKVLTVQNNGKTNETNVCQYEEGKPIADNQKWVIKDAGNGYYNIISKSSGLYLDLYGGYSQNGTNIQIYKGHGKDSQRFKFVAPEDVLSQINTSKYPGYKEKITALMDKHPGWNFELLETGLRFEQVIAGETALHSRNLIPKSYSGEWICSTCGTKLYDSGWYCASGKAVAYYMDPRNYLDENNVFQFQDINEYINNVCTLQGIQTKVNGTFLQNYATSIDNACKNQNVNSYYIIARVLQEQGSKGTTIGTGMDGGDGKTYYNPFNIGASGNGYSQIYANALATAKKNGWDSMQKALEGGITFCKKNWLENYQNTLYLNKFDIDKRSGGNLYEHQYMQNFMAAHSEASTLRSMYASTAKIDSNFTFIIPMYENMTSESLEQPSKNQETAPMNVQVTAKDGIWLRKEANENSQTIKLINLNEIILSVQRGINSSWHKIVLQDGTIGYMSGDYLKQVNDVTNCNYIARVKTADGVGCNVRVGPSTSLDIVTAIAENSTVTVINQGTYNNINGYNWYRVQLSNGQQGFMPANFLTK